MKREVTNYLKTYGYPPNVVKDIGKFIDRVMPVVKFSSVQMTRVDVIDVSPAYYEPIAKWAARQNIPSDRLWCHLWQAMLIAEKLELGK